MAIKSNGYWSEDLLAQILSRLPVKSIIRFKSVAKSWSPIFENPGFVSQHLSINKNNNCFLVCHEDDTFHTVIMHLSLDQTPVSYHDLLPQKPIDDCTICFHDGLICLCDTFRSSITICNPATREFRLLPECNENMPPMADTFRYIVGFGSDSLSNDYKVIYMQSYVDLETGINGAHPAVYRMSTDSWRVLEGEDVETFPHLFVVDSNVSINGAYYWVAYNSYLGDFKVLAFHFDNEVFQLIDWPTIPNNRDSASDLLPLPDDRISLCLPRSDVTNRSYDIWVLKDEGRDWTKLFRIGPLPGVESMLGFCNNKRKGHNKVFVQTMMGQLLLYDLDTQQFIDITIKNREGSEYKLKVYSYKESLVHC